MNSAFDFGFGKCGAHGHPLGQLGFGSDLASSVKMRRLYFYLTTVAVIGFLPACSDAGDDDAPGGLGGADANNPTNSETEPCAATGMIEVEFGTATASQFTPWAENQTVSIELASQAGFEFGFDLRTSGLNPDSVQKIEATLLALDDPIGTSTTSGNSFVCRGQYGTLNSYIGISVSDHPDFLTSGELDGQSASLSITFFGEAGIIETATFYVVLKL
ncbi:MAG: hypothetical protein MK135_03940 [Polyangiaceae bacterium]|nr:hypothetical protein [Polyangiaceae bacterium]